jgi:hypothetical protein
MPRTSAVFPVYGSRAPSFVSRGAVIATTMKKTATLRAAMVNLSRLRRIHAMAPSERPSMTLDAGAGLTGVPASMVVAAEDPVGSVPGRCGTPLSLEEANANAPIWPEGPGRRPPP